ncbi:metallophosphoesterase [Metallosphaera javensis (ex Sakai et al. 2022)]|uniref:metallophosphoesterase n=1 Tax=Metallosphaera javensis (ex Sakai et al. 2022) TaxID=2775498 RepID=UPI00258A2CF8|nr:MAG: 3',5'-cyclic adenosine monophosphate phosphodiesterase CpdA [Metallosphaera javensis (ex Sakai et al. 2022)]
MRVYPVKVLFASDVHYPDGDRTSRLFSLLRGKPDLLVLAGDLITLGSVQDLRKFFVKLRKVYQGPVVGVPGNHEHWLTRGERDRGITSLEKVEMIAEVYREFRGVLLQVDGPFQTDSGLTLVGTTGWYDYSFARDLNFSVEDFENCNPYHCTREELMACEKRGYCDCKSWFNDCIYVNLGMSNEEYLRLNVRILEDQLRSVKDAVVVLHHAPRKDLIKVTGEREKDFFLAFDGSERLEEVIRNHGVEHVIYGHLHEGSRQDHVTVDGVRYVNGYRFQLMEM